MTKQRVVFFVLPLGLIMLFTVILPAQNAKDAQSPDQAQTPAETQDTQSPQNDQTGQNSSGRPFIVNGRQVGSVVQMDGRSYVDVETLAQATNGSVTLEPNRVVLRFPAGGGSQSPAAEPAAPEPLSRNFAAQAIGLLAEMREWRGAIGTILMYNTPVVGTWPDDYRGRVRLSLDQLRLAVMTADDGNAMDLIENEFENLATWSDNVVSTRDNLDATKSVRPTALQDDPQLAKITSCSRFLSSMLVSGQFSDDPSCH